MEQVLLTFPLGMVCCLSEFQILALWATLGSALIEGAISREMHARERGTVTRQPGSPPPLPCTPPFPLLLFAIFAIFAIVSAEVSGPAGLRLSLQRVKARLEAPVLAYRLG